MSQIPWATLRDLVKIECNNRLAQTKVKEDPNEFVN